MAVRVVVLGVVVVQDVVVVVVVVVHVVGLAHRVVEVRVAFVLAVLVGVGRRPRRFGVTLRRHDGHLRRQHRLLLLRQPAGVQAARVVAVHTGAVRLHIWRKKDNNRYFDFGLQQVRLTEDEHPSCRDTTLLFLH